MSYPLYRAFGHGFCLLPFNDRGYDALVAA
jgi:hypothetical protein